MVIASEVLYNRENISSLLECIKYIAKPKSLFLTCSHTIRFNHNENELLK